MKLFCIVALDYPLMTAEQRDEAHKLAVVCPPFIEESERSYTNEILRTFLFVDIEQSNAKLFKSQLVKQIDRLDSKLSKLCEKLRTNEVVFLFVVCLSLKHKIDFVSSKSEQAVGSLAEDKGMIGSILIYINNYLLYSEGGSTLQVALECTVDRFSKQYLE